MPLILRRLIIIAETDSTAVEYATAAFIAVMGLFCWLGGWFTYWFHNPALSGAEAAVGFTCVYAACVQCYMVHKRKRWGRWMCSLVFAAFLMAIGLNSFTEHGIHSPGGPVSTLGALVQLWVCLAVASDMRYG